MRKHWCYNLIITAEGVGERAPFNVFVKYRCNQQNQDRAVQGLKSVTHILKHISELCENHQIFTKMKIFSENSAVSSAGTLFF